MSHWPVPQSNNRTIPVSGQPGSFWEDRGDRHHAGVDMYAPELSDVIAIEDGEVVEVKVFSGPEMIHYWNVTYSIFIKNSEGKFLRYAELHDAVVKEGDHVQGGQLVGHVGAILNLDKINETSPEYVQKLKKKGLPAMLHFEIYTQIPNNKIKYMGGNYFHNEQPADLVDPTPYLQSINGDK
jgi:murein DD-endopeptidase MepM/ murein hydrolase activator NlpD